jgi:hypothetical protein
MSSSNRSIIGELKARLGFLLVIAGSAVVVTLILHNKVAALLGTVVVAIVAMLLISGRSVPSSSTERDNARWNYKRGTFSHSWRLQDKPDLADIGRALANIGFSAGDGVLSEDRIVQQRGSQFRTRLRGGYFVAPQKLPVEVELTVARGDTGSWVLNMVLRDRLGVAIRDDALKQRYGLVDSEIQGVVEGGL